MKPILTLLFLLTTMTTHAVRPDRIEPAFWYAGMHCQTLQLMVYGQGIRDAQATIDDKTVTLDSIVRLDSPNYLLLYINLHGAQPGTFRLNIAGRKLDYQLRKRDMPGADRHGFTNADVLYMLMPDRFARADNAKNTALPKTRHPYNFNRTQPSLRHGGNLEGIRQKLDYFRDLGVTALWLTPVLENDSPDTPEHQSCYHGYATTDYYKVDPRFGTNDDYRRLIDDAHAKGLKVVMDMIFNHCGDCHPWLADMPSKDWFNQPDYKHNYLQTSYKLTPVLDPYASQVDKRETIEGWFVPSMPDLNQHNPHVMRYLTQNSIWWIETAGIDGIRMDTYPYAYADAMAAWMKTLNDEYPNFNTVGETWVTEPAYTATWQKDSPVNKLNSNLKTVMDFSFYEKINLACREETDQWFAGMNRIYNSLAYDYLYPDPTHVMAFLDNHDTDRFVGDRPDTLALRQALALLLTIRRIPQIYYGTEIMMPGTKAKTDGNVRRDFPGGFPGDTRNAFTPEGRTKAENATYNYLKRLLHYRQGNDVIIKGRQTQFIPIDGVYVIARTLGERAVMTVINGTTKTAKLQTKRYKEIIGRKTKALDITTGHHINLTDTIPLRPRQTMILEM